MWINICGRVKFYVKVRVNYLQLTLKCHSCTNVFYTFILFMQINVSPAEKPGNSYGKNVWKTPLWAWHFKGRYRSMTFVDFIYSKCHFSTGAIIM